MLKQFIYSELIQYQQEQNTEVGVVNPDQNNSQRTARKRLNEMSQNAFNKGVDFFRKYQMAFFSLNERLSIL